MIVVKDEVGVLKWTFLSTFFFQLSCALTAVRPTQLMSDTVAAVRAAQEVQADVLSVDLFRQAQEWLNRAKQEYKFKNFDLAIRYAQKSKRYAENAEYEAIRAGGVRGGEVGTEAEHAPGSVKEPALLNP